MSELFYKLPYPNLNFMEILNEDHEFTEKINGLEKRYNVIKYAILFVGITTMIMVSIFQ